MKTAIRQISATQAKGAFSPVEIRKSAEADLDRIMEIYARARRFMAEHGNPNQWGPTNWPPESLIRQDIDLSLIHI